MSSGGGRAASAVRVRVGCHVLPGGGSAPRQCRALSSCRTSNRSVSRTLLLAVFQGASDLLYVRDAGLDLRDFRVSAPMEVSCSAASG